MNPNYVMLQVRREKAEEEMKTAYAAFRHTPSATNYLWLQNEMVAFQAAVQAIWDHNEALR